MNDDLLRQHQILTEKLGSAEQSWQQLQQSLPAASKLPTQASANLQNFKPAHSISLAAHWYLVARQQQFHSNPPVLLSASYPVALLVLTIIVAAILSVKVLPILTSSFDLHSSQLPALTHFIQQYFEWIAGATVAIISALIFLTNTINNALRNMRPAPDWTLKTGLFNDWLHKHNRLVTGTKLQAWRQAGVPFNSDHAADLISAEEWQLAEACDTLTETLKAATPSIDPAVIAHSNQQINIISMAIIGPVIGGLVIAIYLPIFQIGSIA